MSVPSSNQSSNSSSLTITPSSVSSATTVSVTAAQSSSDESHESCQMFACNICLTPAKDPVVSFCGHLFCWPCLHQVLEPSPSSKLKENIPQKSPSSKTTEIKSFKCPACKVPIDKEQIVPLYGRDGDSRNDSRKNIVPPRPRGRNQIGGAFGLGGPNSDPSHVTDLIIIAWFIFLFALWYLFC